MENTHGGFRKNAGRKKGIGYKLTKENSTVIRVSLKEKERIKSGQYESLIYLLYDWKIQSLDNSKTSPRYEKLREFLSEVDEILGEDVDTWIE